MASLKEGFYAAGDADDDALDLPEGWEPVAVYAGRDTAQESGLAILAMGQAYWILPYSGQYVLCVRTPDVPTARAELSAVAALRSREGKSAAPVFHDFSPGWSSFMVYAGVLSVIYFLQAPYGLIEAGGFDAVAIIREGQLWRAVTALTLHGDVVHLVANLVSGAGFAFLVARFFGAAAGWFLILGSGVLGNLLNAWVYFPDPHRSLGASTAVFAALGLITGVGLLATWRDSKSGLTLPNWLLPVFGGLTLLGLLGLGDGDIMVDVAAHIAGFVCGTAVGLIAAMGQRIFVRLEACGPVIAVATLGLIGWAWVAALL